jgi:hypothetical protein
MDDDRNPACSSCGCELGRGGGRERGYAEAWMGRTVSVGVRMETRNRADAKKGGRGPK